MAPGVDPPRNSVSPPHTGDFRTPPAILLGPAPARPVAAPAPPRSRTSDTTASTGAGSWPPPSGRPAPDPEGSPGEAAGQRPPAAGAQFPLPPGRPLGRPPPGLDAGPVPRSAPGSLPERTHPTPCPRSSSGPPLRPCLGDADHVRPPALARVVLRIPPEAEERPIGLRVQVEIPLEGAAPGTSIGPVDLPNRSGEPFLNGWGARHRWRRLSHITRPARRRPGSPPRIASTLRSPPGRDIPGWEPRFAERSPEPAPGRPVVSLNRVGA